MSCDADIQAGLSLLFQRGLELALRIQEDAMEAEPAERAKLAIAFHRISRSVRQTAALKSKLERDAFRAEREATGEARADHQRAVERRQGQIKARVQELIWSEHEGEKAETLEFTLDELLEADALEDDFLDLPIETQVARLAEDFRLPSPSPLAGEGVGRTLTDEGSISLSTETAPCQPPAAPDPFARPPPPPNEDSGRSSGTGGWMG